MGLYKDELTKAMTWLGEKEDTLFLGQAVGYEGTAMTGTLTGVSNEKKIELPVFEETQMGICTGLALTGKVPICIFPRWNFLLCATNQIVNHLDKIRIMSQREFNPKVIIRVGIGSERPLHPQHQHVGDFTHAFRQMLKTIPVYNLYSPSDVMECYEEAYNGECSSILVEHGDFYNEK